MMADTDYTLDPKFLAGIDLLRRSGMASFQIRWSDDERPVVWFAVASYRMHNGRPRSEGPINAHETAAALDPVVAVLRLCEQTIDGGRCVHCQRPTIFHADLDRSPLPFDDLMCSYEWDPELATYRRSCE